MELRRSEAFIGNTIMTSQPRRRITSPLGTDQAIPIKTSSQESQVYRLDLETWEFSNFIALYRNFRDRLGTRVGFFIWLKTRFHSEVHIFYYL